MSHHDSSTIHTLSTLGCTWLLRLLKFKNLLTGPLSLSTSFSHTIYLKKRGHSSHSLDLANCTSVVSFNRFLCLLLFPIKTDS